MKPRLEILHIDGDRWGFVLHGAGSSPFTPEMSRTFVDVAKEAGASFFLIFSDQIHVGPSAITQRVGDVSITRPE